MGKARIATGAFLVTLVTAAMGYAIASAVLTYQDLGFGVVMQPVHPGQMLCQGTAQFNDAKIGCVVRISPFQRTDPRF